MVRFTVILSEIVPARIPAACCMPARKLAGAAMAAASNKRLMVMPPDVTATLELAAACASVKVDEVPWLHDDGIGDSAWKNVLTTSMPASFAAEGMKLA